LSKQKIDMHQEKMYALVEEWSISGLSKKVFSERAGIGYNTFLYWAQKWSRENQKSHENNIETFLPLQEDSPSSMQNGLLEVTYPNGVKLSCPASISITQ
jgi:hypothetical protein